MENQNCNWGCGLPNHLLECIAERVESCRDLLQFASVCQDWRHTAKEVAKERVVYTPMVLVGDDKDSHALWAFDAAAGRFLNSKLSVPYEKRLCASSFGWLSAVNKDFSITLHKPFSSASPAVHLPPLLPLGQYPQGLYPYHISKLILSADPEKNRNECVVVALVRGSHDITVFRLSRDSAWRTVRCPGSDVPQDLLLLPGTSRVYAVGYNADVFFIDLDHIDQDCVYIRPMTGRSPWDNSNCYLVRSHGGDTTYLVQRSFKKNKHTLRRTTSSFELFTVDLVTGKCDKVTSIGENVMFLGDYSVCVKAPSSGWLQPNCIYFTHDIDMMLSYRHEISDMGIYDIGTCRFKARYALPQATFQAIQCRPPILLISAINF